MGDFKKSEIVDSLQDPKKLFNKLREFWRDEIGNEEKSLNDLLIEINKELQTDFCELGEKSIDEGHNSFEVHHVLEKAIYLTGNLILIQ